MLQLPPAEFGGGNLDSALLLCSPVHCQLSRPLLCVCGVLSSLFSLTLIQVCVDRSLVYSIVAQRVHGVSAGQVLEL